jgi:hypothetical protein
MNAGPSLTNEIKLLTTPLKQISIANKAFVEFPISIPLHKRVR